MDKRRQQSKRAIQNAFLELLEERDYEQITASDVIERAGVGRATFYSHFRGKDELPAVLVGYVCAHALSPAGPEADHDFTDHHDDLSAVEHMLCHLRSNDCGMHRLLVGGGARVLADTLRRQLAESADKRLPQELPPAAAAMGRDFLVNHIAGSFVEMVIWWARRDFDREPHDLAQSYLAAIRPLLAS